MDAALDKEAQAAEDQRARLFQGELACILEAHGRWVASNGKEGKPASLVAAQGQGADLNSANLQGAKLINAQLQGADLRYADLTDASFRDADLSNTQLATVTGLRAESLAGTILTNAKLPPDIARF